MGTYGKVVCHEMQPIADATAALAAFRENATRFVENADLDDPMQSYAISIAALLPLDDFALLTSIAEDERWSVELENNTIQLYPPGDDVKDGVAYGFVDWLCPHVSGFIQLEYEMWDDQHRVVWKNGKSGRMVDPVWPDPAEEEE